MQPRIPSSIENQYAFLRWKDRFYLHARWRLCPFLLIEQYIPQRGTIIDVGCGYGMLAHLLAQKPERTVIGIDASPKRITIAQYSARGKQNLYFEHMKVQDLHLEAYDAIVMSDFLHHIPFHDQETLIQQAKQKLKPDGILIIQDIDKRPTWKYLIAAGLDTLLNWFPYLYYRKKTNFKHLLERNGFDVLTVNADRGLPLPDVLFICTKSLEVPIPLPPEPERFFEEELPEVIEVQPRKPIELKDEELFYS